MGDKTRKFTPTLALPHQGGGVLSGIFSWLVGDEPVM